MIQISQVGTVLTRLIMKNSMLMKISKEVLWQHIVITTLSVDLTNTAIIVLMVVLGMSVNLVLLLLTHVPLVIPIMDNVHQSVMVTQLPVVNVRSIQLVPVGIIVSIVLVLVAIVGLVLLLRNAVLVTRLMGLVQRVVKTTHAAHTQVVDLMNTAMMVLGATIIAGPVLLLLTHVTILLPIMENVHQRVMVTQLLVVIVRSIQRVPVEIIAPKVTFTTPVCLVRLLTTRVQHTQLMVVVLRVVLQMLTIHLFWT